MSTNRRIAASFAPPWAGPESAPIAAEIDRAELRRHIEFDQFQIVGAPHDVVRNPCGLRQAFARFHRDLVGHAGIPEADPAAQHDVHVRGHVVPVPSGGSLEGSDRADVARADLSGGGRRQAQVAIFDVRIRGVAVKFGLHVGDGELRERGLERERAFVSRRLGRQGHALSPGEFDSAVRSCLCRSTCSE